MELLQRSIGLYLWMVPDQRPSMQEVVPMMEVMNRGETDEVGYQSLDDPSNGSDTCTSESRRIPPRPVKDSFFFFFLVFIF